MTRHLHCTLEALAAAALLAWAAPVAAKITLMHGYADYTSALVWIQAEAAGPIEVTWTPAGGAERRATFDAAAGNDYVVVARLTGLEPGSSTSYRVRGDGDELSATIATQRYWEKSADAAPITVAFGSCFFLAEADPIWGSQDYAGGFEIFDAIASKRPDAMLWLGDNLYFHTPDFYDPSKMSERYRRQRSFAPLSKLLTATSHLAIWDDHDYGPNDADMSYTMKGETLALFKRYWANPGYGLPEVNGVFGMARLGDVDIFLLDDRYYRSPNNAIDGPDKTMFGARQLEWLKAALLYSHAKIKLVANGSQMWNRTDRYEGFNHYETEQKGLYDWLVANRIDGLIFLTGDRHFGELLRVARAGAPPIYEFTSSPLTSKPYGGPGPEEKVNPDLVGDTFFAERQFGLLTITGPANDRLVAMEAYDASGKRLWRHEVRARDLAFAKK